MCIIAKYKNHRFNIEYLLSGVIHMSFPVHLSKMYIYRSKDYTSHTRRHADMHMYTQHGVARVWGRRWEGTGRGEREKGQTTDVHSNDIPFPG